MSKYHDYYDKLYSQKNYASEVEVLLEIYKKINKSRPAKVLDVGCGTGSHGVAFGGKGIRLVGVDTDQGMVNVAVRKSERGLLVRPTFLCCEVQQLKQRNFDMAISMFNVVNYIDTATRLTDFFTGIYKRLKKDGVLVFDCWNGVAVIADPPQVKKHRLHFPTETIVIKTVPKTIDLMSQRVTMCSSIRVNKKLGGNENLNVSYGLMLWTPRQICDCLQTAGFLTPRISRWMQPREKATSKDWKIMLICKKSR